MDWIQILAICRAALILTAFAVTLSTSGESSKSFFIVFCIGELIFLGRILAWW